MPAGPGLDRALLSPRGSSLLLLSGLFAVQLTAILATAIPRSAPGRLAPLLACAVAVFILQLLNSAPAALRWPVWRRLGMLTAQGVATFLPLVTLGTQWPGMVGFFAGSILILLPPRFSWALFVVVIGAALFAPPGLCAHPADSVYLMTASLGGGLTVYGVWWMCLAFKRERRASTELVQLTTVRERERFSRDLHDLLGYSLSAITLKTELTRRLVSSDPAQARDELADVAGLARQAAADVRLVAHGYRNVSLVREAAAVTSLLSAAGVDVRVEIGCGVLDDKVDTVFATVLREAVTNILRHGAARSCTIEASHDDDEVTLAVTNDGAMLPAQRSPRGYGLENLAWRLEAIGGRLGTVVSDDRFCLRATAPAWDSPCSPVSGPRARPGLLQPASAPGDHRELPVPGPSGREESAGQSASSDAARSRRTGQYRRPR
jgi:two-component system, NarL family, sensor histidine kinase DesK